MSDRFSGKNGKVFIGAHRDGKVDMHTYAMGNGSNPHFVDSVPVEDLIAAVNLIPGVTATYDKPKPPKVELPKGIGAVVDSGWSRYVRVSEDNWRAIESGNVFSNKRLNDYTGGWTILSEGVEV